MLLCDSKFWMSNFDKLGFYLNNNNDLTNNLFYDLTNYALKALWPFNLPCSNFRIHFRILRKIHYYAQSFCENKETLIPKEKIAHKKRLIYGRLSSLKRAEAQAVYMQRQAKLARRAWIAL